MTPDGDRRGHWDRRYEAGAERVSWFERAPRASLEMIALTGAGPGASVLDVGGGAAPLAGALLEGGFADVTVLDVSEEALRAARDALGPRAARVRWIPADVLGWTPGRRYDLWHDRAVFHFLVDPAERARYVAAALTAVGPGGHLVIGAFSEDGPQTCSGLPVARYDAGALAAAFGPGLEPVAARRREHRTPGGAVQAFTWVALRVAAGLTSGWRSG